MRTIALINRKGGSGKTMVAVHLATAFQMHGVDTLVLDLDPQSSASEWHDARADKLPHVQSVQPARLAKVVEHAREIGTGMLVLDTAPHSEATALDAARCADLALIPCRPSITDLRAMRQTVELLKLVQVPAFALLNGIPPIGTVADEAAELIESLGLAVAPVRLGDRVAFDRCGLTGQTAQETEPLGKAATEVGKLYEWVCTQLHIPAGQHVRMNAGPDARP